MAPPVRHNQPPTLSAVEVDVSIHPGEPATPVVVPASSSEEAFRILYNIGNGLAGSGTRHFYYGSVLEPIRNSYKAELEQLEAAIRQRRATLGVNATEYELRGLAQWAARQRAQTARVFRIPTPSLLAGLEARDWREYGPGGRTFENLLKRNAKRGVTGTAAYERIIGSAVKSNAEVNLAVSRGAHFLRRGGAILGVAGLAVSAYDIIKAPPGQRLAVAEHQAVGYAGGLVGAEVGATLLAVGAGLLAATPPGWVVIGVGLVGGFVGSMIAEHVFFPKDHKPVAAQLEAGQVVNPHAHSHHGHAAAMGRASTILPVIRQVVLTVGSHDTQQSLLLRAYQQAAASVGLFGDSQKAFAQKWMARSSDVRWVAGDPSPESDDRLRQSDLAKKVGQKVVYELDDDSRNELRQAGEAE